MGNFDPYNGPQTKGQIEKATKFLTTGRVHIQAATVYEVEGDSGMYIVVIFPEDSKINHSCTCPRIGTCSHISAAMLFDQKLHEAIDENIEKHNARLARQEKRIKRHLKAVE